MVKHGPGRGLLGRRCQWEHIFTLRPVQNRWALAWSIAGPAAGRAAGHVILVMMPCARDDCRVACRNGDADSAVLIEERGEAAARGKEESSLL